MPKYTFDKNGNFTHSEVTIDHWIDKADLVDIRNKLFNLMDFFQVDLIEYEMGDKNSNDTVTFTKGSHSITITAIGNSLSKGGTLLMEGPTKLIDLDKQMKLES